MIEFQNLIHVWFLLSGTGNRKALGIMHDFYQNPVGCNLTKN